MAQGHELCCMFEGLDFRVLRVVEASCSHTTSATAECPSLRLYPSSTPDIQQASPLCPPPITDTQARMSTCSHRHNLPWRQEAVVTQLLAFPAESFFTFLLPPGAGFSIF